MMFVKWLDYTLGHIFTPEIIAIVSSIMVTLYHMVNRIDKRVDDNHKIMIDEMKSQLNQEHELNEERYRDTTKEIVRLQILEGIESRRLSASEVSYFYKKYRKLGGNSFVTKKVEKYLQSLEDEDTDGNPDNTK